MAYPSTQFLLAKRRERKVPNDPRRQHTRVPSAGSARSAAEWQCERDVSPRRCVAHGVLSMAGSARTVWARRSASDAAHNPSGARARAGRGGRASGHRRGVGVADARAAVGERPPGPAGADRRPGDGVARVAAGRTQSPPSALGRARGSERHDRPVDRTHGPTPPGPPCRGQAAGRPVFVGQFLTSAS